MFIFQTCPSCISRGPVCCRLKLHNIIMTVVEECLLWFNPPRWGIGSFPILPLMPHSQNIDIWPETFVLSELKAEHGPRVRQVDPWFLDNSFEALGGGFGTDRTGHGCSNLSITRLELLSTGRWKQYKLRPISFTFIQSMILSEQLQPPKLFKAGMLF